MIDEKDPLLGRSDRKTKIVQISSEDRDNGLVFYLTEKSAVAAEKWAIKVFLALARTGQEIPKEIAQMGILGIAVIGIEAGRFLSFEAAESILDDLMTCVEVVPNPDKLPDFRRKLVENDVSEVRTLMLLKREVLELHLGFSLADAEQLGGLLLSATEALKTSSSSSTQTSQEPLAP